MKNRTRLTLVIGAVAAIISAVVLIIVFWDKLLEKCTCRDTWEDDFDLEEEPEEEIVTYPEEELADFADLSAPEAE